MAAISVVKLKVRRGTDNDRKLVILDQGEIGYVTDADSRRLFVGDGSTYGGYPAGIKFYSGDFNPPAFALKTAQVGDVIYNPIDTKMYVLTGIDANYQPDYDNPQAYQFIGARTDNTTVEYNLGGQIQVKDSGITSTKLNPNVVNTTQGLSKIGGGTISVKVDNTSVEFNGSGELTVKQSGINAGSINLDNELVNIGTLRIDVNNLNTFAGDRGIIYYDPISGVLKVSL